MKYVVPAMGNASQMKTVVEATDDAEMLLIYT
jgi:hypothetical protein